MSHHPQYSPTSVPSRRRFLAHAFGGMGALAIGPIGWPINAAAQTGTTGCRYLQDNWSEAVRGRLASRAKRLHHFVWHLTRNSWHALSDQQRSAVDELGWAPPRPSIVRPAWDTRTHRQSGRHWATHTGAGEDFLFFHRRMIAQVDLWLEEEGRQHVVAWSDSDVLPPPGSGCPDEGVPASWEVPDAPALSRRLQQVKSDAYFYDRMVPWQRRYTDYAHLRTLTLGELGARLEIGIHNNMHMRWSAMPWNPHVRGPAPWLREEGDIDPAWDDARYDTLLDEYSAHVHPLFWRLHKWVDNRIKDWAEAHGDIVERDIDGIPWFAPGDWVQVSEPWIGAPTESEQTMARVVEAITAPPTDDDVAAALGAVPGGQAVTLRDLVAF